MRVLVVGAGGLLGSNLVTAGRAHGWEVVGTYHSSEPALPVELTQLDVRNRSAFTDLLGETAPNVVVNCAAIADVDACESDPEYARAVNGDAPGVMAAVAAEQDIVFVQTSTDYVFDGRSETPYEENATPNPLQVYGRSKVRGERTVRDANENALVTRTSFNYGIDRGTDELVGFPRWVRDTVRAGNTVPAFTDQWVSPTRAGAAAETIVELIADGGRGTYHVSSRTCATPFEFARKLIDEMDAAGGELDRSTRDEVDRLATRPQRTCLSTDRTESRLVRSQPTLAEDITAIKPYL